jgi:hypothetical protein
MREWSLKGKTNQALSGDGGKRWVFTVFNSEVLVRKVSSSSITDNEIFVVLHSIKTVLSFRENIAVRLTVHSFSSKSSCNHIDFLGAIFAQVFWELEQLDFDTYVFLWSSTLSNASVVIGAWLIIKSGEYGVFLAVDNFSEILKGFELPSDERIIEWIRGSGDEGSSPIGTDAESLQIFLSFWWEES